MPMSDANPDFMQKQFQFTSNLREPDRCPAPKDVDPERMVLYQQMIFQNISATLVRAFPVLRSLYSDEGWVTLVKNFIAIHKFKRPTTHEIPEEFLHYLSYVRREPGDPSWIYELAHYEWVELALSLSPIALAEMEFYYEGNLLSEVPVLSPLAWIQVYRYPVHTIQPGFLPSGHSPTPTYLVVYRNWDDKVNFLHINDFAYHLLLLLGQEHQPITGREALMQLVKLSEHPDPAIVIQGGSLLLEDLRERHIILGTAP